MTFKVLSIDGGGIKGIVPARILQEIETRTQRPICKIFDLIVGTSTGGILALGLTKPDPNNPNNPCFTAQDLVNLYVENGTNIFTPRTSNLNNQVRQIGQNFLNRAINNWQNIGLNIDDLISTRYYRTNKRQILEEKLEHTNITDALTEVLITSYEVSSKKPFFFTSNTTKEAQYRQYNNENFYLVSSGYRMIQAALATSAAPTYFKPYILNDITNSNNHFVLIDGGVLANNPTIIAIVEAIQSYRIEQNTSLPLNEMLILSLGTGNKNQVQNTTQIESWGQIKWAMPLFKILFNGQNEMVNYLTTQLFSSNLFMSNQNEPNPRYYRFQPFYPNNNLNVEEASMRPEELIDVSEEMDNVSEYNITQLQQAADFLITRQNDYLDRLIKDLNE